MGQPAVTDFIADGIDEQELLARTTAVERESEHPLAAAVVQYAEQRGAHRLTAGVFAISPATAPPPRSTRTGVIVGNRTLMANEQVDLGSLAARRDQLAATGRIAVFVAVDGRAAGVIAIADAPVRHPVGCYRTKCALALSAPARPGSRTSR